MISFMALYMCQVLHVVDFLGFRRMENAPTSIVGKLCLFSEMQNAVLMHCEGLKG